LDADGADQAGGDYRPDCMACRANAGQLSVLLAESVVHLHIHLIPRRPDLPEHLRGPRVFDLLRQAAETGVGVPDAEAAAMAQAVRRQLGPDDFAN